MTGYMINFLVYTLAMIGIIFVGFLVAKKSLSVGITGSRNRFLDVESSLSLEPRKNLYVVKAGAERFLISTDPEGSRFLTKLGDESIPDSKEYAVQNTGSDINFDIPVLNIAKNIFKNYALSKKGLRTGSAEKLNAYVTFQRP